VTPSTIIEVVSEIVGHSIQNDEDKADLYDSLNRTVIGQSNAMEKLCRAIKRSSSELHDERKPKGIFLFVGESGIGKTETAYALAKELFGSRDSLIRYDMSEYSESFSTSKLIGSAPGYVGYEETNTPLDKIRYQPYSVILFDEIEKAHPNVHALLLQIFDNGILTDSKGRKINFRNSYIVMTSNLCSESSGFSDSIGFISGGETDNVYKMLKNCFKDEFLNRIDEIIKFNSLDFLSLKEIARIKLESIREKAKGSNLILEYTDKVTEKLAKKAIKEKQSARSLLRLISSEIEFQLISIINENKDEETAFLIDASEEDFLFKKLNPSLLI
jgi:ATP-dependent Clp protease ATP-binding subunit ClpA